MVLNFHSVSCLYDSQIRATLALRRLDITADFVVSCFYIKNYKRGGDNVEHLTVFNQREFVLHAGS